MGVEIVEVITGPEWARFSKACMAESSTLMRNVRQEIRKEAKPMIAEMKAGAKAYMPDRYAIEMTATLRTQTSVTARGIYIRGRANTPGGRPRELRKLEKGMLRHPLFGNRNHWYPQVVRPGFWAEGLSRHSDNIMRGIRRVMDAAADRIAG